jgi:hypothetical protein
MIRTAIVVCCIALFLSGCAGKKLSVNEPVSSPLGTKKLATLGQASAVPTDEDRMIVSTAALNIKSPNPDSVQLAVIALAYAGGGYVLNSGENITSIRIPTTGYADALAAIEQMGRVLERKITGQDVTEEYVDLVTRLDNLEKTRQRFLSLLQKATELNAIVQMEKELAALTSQIEILKGKINRLAHLVEYTTITVVVTPEAPPIRLGPVAWVAKQAYVGVRSLFIW